MDLAEAQELGVLQARNQAQDARLLAEFQVILEAHQVEAVGAQVLLAELHHGPRAPAGARIGQAHGLHGAEAQRVAPAPRQLLDGQAGFEKRRIVFGDVRGDGLRREQLVHEALVLLAVERAVQIIVRAVDRFAVARSPEGDAGIHRIGLDDGADAVVEEQPAGAGEARDLCGQRVAGERAGGDDGDAVRESRSTSSRRSSMQRLGFDGGGDFRREDLAIHGERMAAGHARLVGGGEQQRIEAPQFLLQQPGRGGFRLGFERVAAHQLGQAAGLVRGRGARRPHLIEHRAEPAPRDLPGRLGCPPVRRR